MRERPEESITIAGRTLTPDELRQLLDGESEDGIPWWLLNEALASVAMSHDDRAQTYAVDSHPVED